VQEHTDTYQSFFEHAVEGIFRTTPDGTYLAANPALARIYGYASPAELMAEVRDIAHQIYVEPERRMLFRNMLQTQGTVSDFESLVYRKDGRMIWISESARAVYDAEGHLCYYEGFVFDITHRKQVEDTLQRREIKHRALLDAMPDLMFFVNHEGTLLSYRAGKGRTWRVSLDALIGKRVTDLLPETSAHRSQQYIQKALATGTMQIFEFQFPIEGLLHDYEARLVVSGYNEVLAIVREITERKKAERLKNEFVSIVSHELRTPLTSIRGSLGLIMGTMAQDLPPRARTMVEIAHKNSERLVSLVNDILDIDKIESGKMVFDLQPVELDSLLLQAIEANRAYGEQFGVTFVIETTLPNVQVYADSDRLLQVLTNLLSNAAKFSSQGSTVRLSLTRNASDSTLHVAVRDSGPGIPEEFQSHIFQKFAQADSSDTRQKGGSGLGLSISKAIIEKMGGKIGFESQTGVGTTFFFALPEWHEEGQVYDSVQHHPRVLICEDTPDLASMLSLMLHHHGFNTDIAYNTDQARQFLANNQYAAMTLDLVMPGQSGVDFIRELRGQECTRHLPIVVVSAIAQQGRQELEGGAFEVADWLDKTADHGQLVAAVRRAIARRTDEKPRILHIEDDSDVIEVVAAIIGDTAHMVNASNLEEARDQVQRQAFDLIILDLGLPDGSGLQLLPLLRDPTRKPVPIMIFSADEVGSDTAHHVAAALVKSRTSNAELLETIRSLIGMHTMEEHQATTP
jgi:PAS domain S-box-containing protein